MWMQGCRVSFDEMVERIRGCGEKGESWLGFWVELREEIGVRSSLVDSGLNEHAYHNVQYLASMYLSVSISW